MCFRHVLQYNGERVGGSAALEAHWHRCTVSVLVDWIEGFLLNVSVGPFTVALFVWRVRR